jgi:hypothetical protein
MTLEETKVELVAEIRRQYTECHRRQHDVMREPPRSFEEQESRSCILSEIRKEYRWFIDPALQRLRELCATKEMDGGVWMLNPIEPAHDAEARRLIAGQDT